MKINYNKDHNASFPPRYTSVGISLRGNKTIYDVYRERIQKYNPTVLQALAFLKQGAFREIVRLDPEAAEPLSEEMLILRANSLAGITTAYSISHSGYEIAVGWKQAQCAGTLYCAILAHCFHMTHVGLFIDPKFVPMIDWPKLLPILNVTDLKYIAVPLDDGSTIRRSATGTKFWDAVRNRCFVLAETNRHTIEEIEDGYPYEIDIVTIGEKEIPMDDAFLRQRDSWLATPMLSQEETDQTFYAIACRYSPWKDQL